MTNCPYPASARSKSFHCKLDGDLQREYGPRLTCDVYWTQFWAQDGTCAICGERWPGVPGASIPGIKRMSTDHQHVVEHRGEGGRVVRADGPFRGLLCGACNRLLTRELEREIARRDSDAPFPWTDRDGRQVAITPRLVAYVRNPPAAKLEVWVTKKERPPAKRGPGPKVPPLELDGPSVRELLHRPPRSYPPRALEVRPWHEAPVTDGSVRGRVAMPTPWWVRYEDPPPTPVPVPEPIPARWTTRRVGAFALVSAGGLCALVLAVIIIVKLLPGLLLLAATGLLAARR